VAAGPRRSRWALDHVTALWSFDVQVATVTELPKAGSVPLRGRADLSYPFSSEGFGGHSVRE
jgi:hypothetical protein